MTLKNFTFPLTLKDDGGEEGRFEAVFSTFDIVDLDGDIVRREAIEDGKQVPVLWAHDSFSMPVATGVISTTEKEAVISGKFIDSTAGRNARSTIRATKDMQELSWGFVITKQRDISEEDGEGRREILGTNPLEVSFVLRGAAGFGNTRVTGVKDAQMTLAEQIGHTGVVVQATLDRAKAKARMKHDEKRVLGANDAKALASLHEDFKELEELLGGLGDTRTDAGELTAAARELQATMLRLDFEAIELEV